ncbi:hypothetical protein BKA62DRAFT_717370 [Auriculariales sp. MPI-PUGE-AT-0066]|nr:hypothetical protein BKA62DRAFT_717370 [Auriculariales sp. MPI-PUGE-AT-0066]
MQASKFSCALSLAIGLLSTRALVAAKSVALPFTADAVSFFAPAEASGTPWTFPTGDEAEALCSGSSPGSAASSVGGTGFEFIFAGTAVSLITAPSSAYSISIDGGEPTYIHTQGLSTRAPACGVTFASSELQAGTHKVRVETSEGGQLVFVRAVVNDGDLPQPQVAASQSDQIAIPNAVGPKADAQRKKAVGLAIGLTILAVLLIALVVFLTRRLWHRRQKSGLTKGAVDLEGRPIEREVKPRIVPLPAGDGAAAGRMRKNSAARSSWTSFGGGAANLGQEQEQDITEKDRNSLVEYNDTLTLLRAPPVPQKSGKNKGPRHPFRMPTVHATRPKAGCPTLRVST